MDIKPNIKERIISAANHLVSQGTEKPTNDQVRERLGGGSLSHISPVMREWREKRRKEVDVALDMPEALKKAVQISLGQIWGTASQLASTKTEEVQAQAKTDLIEIQEELDYAVTEVSRLENDLAKMTDKAERQFGELGQFRHEVEALRVDKEKLTIENKALTTSKEERDQAILELRAELKEAREENRGMQSKLMDIVQKVSQSGR